MNSSLTVNDTALTNATVSRLDLPDPLDTLDLSTCPSDDLLDGCKVHLASLLTTHLCSVTPASEKTSNVRSCFINGPSVRGQGEKGFGGVVCECGFCVQIFLCGQPGKRLEKLRRLVSAAGGLRFNQPCDGLTHVVMGDLDAEATAFLDKATHRSEVMMMVLGKGH